MFAKYNFETLRVMPEVQVEEGRTCEPWALTRTTTNKGGGLWLTMAIYADDLNLIGTIDAISQIVPQLKVQFEMKNLGETTMCLHLQVEYLAICILLH